MKARVKVLMIAEMEVAGEDIDAAAQAKLDEFREAVLPELRWGITLYRAIEPGTGSFAKIRRSNWRG